MEENRYFRLYEVEIHQANNYHANNVVKCRLPIGTFENFARVFLNEHNDDGSYLVVTNMCVWDFETNKFL